MPPPAKLITEMTAARQAESTTDWQAEFPGASPVTTTIRNCLIEADRERRRAQLAFDQLQTVLDATRLPMLYWKRPIQRLYDRICRQKSQAELGFFRALTALRRLFSRPKSNTYVASEPLPGTPRPYRDHERPTHDQPQFHRTTHRRR